VPGRCGARAPSRLAQRRRPFGATTVRSRPVHEDTQITPPTAQTDDDRVAAKTGTERSSLERQETDIGAAT
jgi:hypothetical protein